VTTRRAGDGPQTVYAATIGAAWLAVAGRILADGVDSAYDGLPVREIAHVTLEVSRNAWRSGNAGLRLPRCSRR
jgi:hypothetical protein